MSSNSFGTCRQVSVFGRQISLFSITNWRYTKLQEGYIEIVREEIFLSHWYSISVNKWKIFFEIEKASGKCWTVLWSFIFNQLFEFFNELMEILIRKKKSKIRSCASSGKANVVRMSMRKCLHQLLVVLTYARVKVVRIPSTAISICTSAPKGCTLRIV